MSRYLIAGGAGFIGSHLTEALIARGDSVLVIDNFQTSTPQNLSSVRDDPALELRQGDITDRLYGVGDLDGIIHLAGLADPDVYQSNPRQTMELGSVATAQLLELAREQNAAFLFASTSEIYGDPEEHPQAEGYTGNVDPYGPRACYDESKRYAEALIRSYHKQHGVETHIARIFNTYGPRLDDSRVIPTFVRQALRGDDLTVHGDGSQTRSFCFIDDLVRGLLALVDSDYNRPVNLGNPDERRIDDLAELIINETDTVSSLTYTERPDDDPEVRRPDISRARDVLGWEPEVSLSDGLQQTIEHFRGLVT